MCAIQIASLFVTLLDKMSIIVSCSVFLGLEDLLNEVLSLLTSNQKSMTLKVRHICLENFGSTKAEKS